MRGLFNDLVQVEWLVERGLISALQTREILPVMMPLVVSRRSIKPAGTDEEVVDGEQQALRRCMRMAQVLSCLGIQRAIHCELEVAVAEGHNKQMRGKDVGRT